MYKVTHERINFTKIIFKSYFAKLDVLRTKFRDEKPILVSFKFTR